VLAGVTYCLREVFEEVLIPQHPWIFTAFYSVELEETLGLSSCVGASQSSCITFLSSLVSFHPCPLSPPTVLLIPLLCWVLSCLPRACHSQAGDTVGAIFPETLLVIRKRARHKLQSSTGRNFWTSEGKILFNRF